MIKPCQTQVDIVHECNYVPLCVCKNALICSAQFNLVCAWWCLTTFASKKIHAPFSTNSSYYCHERAYHQIYQFHLEGVVLAGAFVSKSGLFEDKQAIVQSAAPPFLYSSPPFPLPTSKQRGWDEGLERNGKQIVHLYLGGDQTLEQILSPVKFLRWSGKRARREARPEQLLFLKNSHPDNQMCRWEWGWSMITFETNLHTYYMRLTGTEMLIPALCRGNVNWWVKKCRYNEGYFQVKYY